MLSRLSAASMPCSTQPDWDIFCTVIDNFGDIGVCWRLARQLATEHGLAIRLWVDELEAFQRICPEIDVLQPVQKIHGVEVQRWNADFPAVIPGDVVIEAFACYLPERFVSAMAERNPPPVWINLDYLSAEAWVSGCHALPSPHPRLPLTKYFFFPGFSQATGGLLRERNLEARREAFCASPQQLSDFWRSLGLLSPAASTLLVSLFAYENPSIADLLTIWAQGDAAVCCLAPVTRSLSAIEGFSGRSLQAGAVVRRGQLEIRILPFVAQADYDRMLWLCDVNFVRGEDSFVRAQWAAKPMVWQIYPQQENAHLAKLASFLDLFCVGLPKNSANAIRSLYQAWNACEGVEPLNSDLWKRWMEALPENRRHSIEWAKNLSNQEDLCSSLVSFCRSKL